MAYPSYYGNYQTPYYQPPQNMAGYQPMMAQQQSPQQTSGILWVQGEEAAKSYMVASGCSVMLMDSDAERFYIKTVDVSGIPQPLRIFEYKEVSNAPRMAPAAYSGGTMDPATVTRAEFEELRAAVARLTESKEDTNDG